MLQLQTLDCHLESRLRGSHVGIHPLNTINPKFTKPELHFMIAEHEALLPTYTLTPKYTFI